MHKGRLSGLLPIGVFLIVFIGSGILFQDFYAMPAIVAFLIALVTAFLQNRSVSFQEKLHIVTSHMGDENVMIMCLIFILAGAFSGSVQAAGGVDSTVNFGLSILPPSIAVTGLFVIGCFISTAMGTSVGTIAALTPIAVGISEKTGISGALCIGAVVCGAMFGDNLSMISDTTIAATRSQGCEMRDKFQVNFFIALPAAIITVIILLIVGRPEVAPTMDALEYSIIKVVPYLLVLILALVGMNVFLVLTLGIFAAGIIGIATGALDIFGFAQNIWSGFTSMNEVFFLTLFCGGMSEMVTHNGGITWLIYKLRGMMRGQKSAQVGIAALVSLSDCATANNTVAIVLSGSMAKDISREYGVDPRRTASLLDVFSCVLQGMIPYGAQLLSAATLSTSNGVPMNPTDVIPNLWYCWVLAIVGILSIFIPFADGVCRRDPWNWEYDVAESGVAAKKAALEAEAAAAEVAAHPEEA